MLATQALKKKIQHLAHHSIFLSCPSPPISSLTQAHPRPLTSMTQHINPMHTMRRNKTILKKPKTYDRIIDVDLQPWIIRIIRTREGHERAWLSASAAGDVDLAAGDIELCTACCGGRVQADLLASDEILA